MIFTWMYDFSGGMYSRVLKNISRFDVIFLSLFCCVNQSLLHRQIGVDAFLEFSCFLEDTIGVNNLISDSPALCKSRLNIWKLMVHILLKLGLGNFEQFFVTLLLLLLLSRVSLVRLCTTP